MEMNKKMSIIKFGKGGGEKREIFVMNIWCLYLKENRKFFILSIVSEVLFLYLFRVVYLNFEYYSIEKVEGVSEVGFKGICKRKILLLFVIFFIGKYVNKVGLILYLD